MEAERPEQIESVDERQFVQLRDQVFEHEQQNENCTECGCGFIAKYENGDRICLYCPNKWNVNCP